MSSVIMRLTRKADGVFSKYIRDRDTTTWLQDETGLSIPAGPCITCQRIIPTFGRGCGHAGHFIARGNKLLRYDPRNVHLQCVTCNKFNQGEQWQHGRAIERLYGAAVLAELEALDKRYKQTGHRYTKEELEHVLFTYAI